MIHLPCTILAVGALKSGPELDIIRKYQKRLRTADIIEIKASSPEGEALLFSKFIKPSDYAVALDERGENLTSALLSQRLLATVGDFKRILFLIGGADGLDKSIRTQAHMLLSFGKLTWPHMLVRAMVCEQIYRIHSILNDHPYHREG